MSWVARAFGRAVIYNTVREGFYEARHHRHQRLRPERLQPVNKETLVQFACPNGHRFTVPFEDSDPTERDLARQQCPTCGDIAHWLAIDFHIENNQ